MATQPQQSLRSGNGGSGGGASSAAAADELKHITKVWTSLQRTKKNKVDLLRGLGHTLAEAATSAASSPLPPSSMPIVPMQVSNVSSSRPADVGAKKREPKKKRTAAAATSGAKGDNDKEDEDEDMDEEHDEEDDENEDEEELRMDSDNEEQQARAQSRMPQPPPLSFPARKEPRQSAAAAASSSTSSAAAAASKYVPLVVPVHANATDANPTPSSSSQPLPPPAPTTYSRPLVHPSSFVSEQAREKFDRITERAPIQPDSLGNDPLGGKRPGTVSEFCSMLGSMSSPPAAAAAPSNATTAAAANDIAYAVDNYRDRHIYQQVPHSVVRYYMLEKASNWEPLKQAVRNGDIGTPKPVVLDVDYVNRFLLCPKWGPFRECAMRNACAMLSIWPPHPAGNFIGCVYVPPAKMEEYLNTGQPPQDLPKFCYFDLLIVYNAAVARSKALGVHTTHQPPFVHRFDEPNGYNSKAMKPQIADDADPVCYPLRYPSFSDFDPAYVEMPILKINEQGTVISRDPQRLPSWAEKKHLLVVDRTRETNMTLINPSSRLDFVLPANTNILVDVLRRYFDEQLLEILCTKIAPGLADQVVESMSMSAVSLAAAASPPLLFPGVVSSHSTLSTIKAAIAHSIGQWTQSVQYLVQSPVCGDFRREEVAASACKSSEQLRVDHESNRFYLALTLLRKHLETERWISLPADEVLRERVRQTTLACLEECFTEPLHANRLRRAIDSKNAPIRQMLTFMRLADLVFRPIVTSARMLADDTYTETTMPFAASNEVGYLEPLLSTTLFPAKNYPADTASHRIMYALCMRISVARYLHDEIIQSAMALPLGMEDVYSHPAAVSPPAPSDTVADVSDKRVRFGGTESIRVPNGNGNASTSSTTRTSDSSADEEADSLSIASDIIDSFESIESSSGTSKPASKSASGNPKRKRAPNDAGSNSSHARNNEPQYRVLRAIADKLLAFCNAHTPLIAWYVERIKKNLPIQDELLTIGAARNDPANLVGVDTKRYVTTCDGPLIYNELACSMQGPHVSEDRKYLPYTSKLVHVGGPSAYLRRHKAEMQAIVSTYAKRVLIDMATGNIVLGFGSDNRLKLPFDIVFGEFRALCGFLEIVMTTDAGSANDEDSPVSSNDPPSLTRRFWYDGLARKLAHVLHSPSSRFLPPLLENVVNIILDLFTDEYTAKDADGIPWKDYSIVFALLIRLFAAHELYRVLDSRLSTTLAEPVSNADGTATTIAAELNWLSGEVWDARSAFASSTIVSPTAPPIDQVRASRGIEYRTRVESIRELLYQLHRFQMDHVPLMDALEFSLQSRESIAGPEPLDIVLNTTLVHPDQKRMRGLSMFENYYPHDGHLGLCEDLLVDCSKEISKVKFVSEVASSDDGFLDMMAKVLPVVCQIRGMKEKNLQTVTLNHAYAAWCTQAIACSFTGGYRSATRRLDAWMCMYVLRWVQSEGASVSVTHNGLLAFMLRENAVLHIRNNPSFHDTISALFPKYQSFERNLVPHTMDRFRKRVFARLEFAIGAELPPNDRSSDDESALDTEYRIASCRYELDMLLRHGLSIDKAVKNPKYRLPFTWPLRTLRPNDPSPLYEPAVVAPPPQQTATADSVPVPESIKPPLPPVSNTSATIGKKSKGLMVFRRPRVDFVKFISKRFKDIGAYHCADQYFRGNLDFPNLDSIIGLDYQLAMVHYVQSIDPSRILENLAWVHKIGLREGAKVIESIYQMYVKREPAKNIRAKLREMEFSEFLRCLMFFYYLRAHYSRRFMPFPREIYERQLRARARQFEQPIDQLPMSLACMYFCSPIGCGRVLSTVAQIHGPGCFGNDRMSIDLTRGMLVCKPRKPAKGSGSVGRASGKGSKAAAAAAAELASDDELPFFDEEYEAYSTPDSAPKQPKQPPRAVEVRCSGLRDAKRKVAKLTAELRAKEQEISALRAQLPPPHGTLTAKTSLPLTATAERAIATTRRNLERALKETENKLQSFEENRRVLRKFVIKASRQIVKQWLKKPCSLASVVSVPILGGAVVHNKLKEKHDAKIYTICPSENCGRTTLFSTSMFSANGFSCGYCDAELRENLVRPMCVCCGRIMYVKPGQVIELKTLQAWRKADSIAATANKKDSNATTKRTGAPPAARSRKRAFKQQQKVEKNSTLKVNKRNRTDPSVATPSDANSSTQSTPSHVQQLPAVVLNIADEADDRPTPSENTALALSAAGSGGNLCDMVDQLTVSTANDAQSSASSFHEAEVDRSQPRQASPPTSPSTPKKRRRAKRSKRDLKAHVGRYARWYADQWSSCELIDEREGRWATTYFCGHCALKISNDDMELFSKQQLLYVIRRVSKFESTREYLASNSDNSREHY